jgi:hypothetical protein
VIQDRGRRFNLPRVGATQQSPYYFTLTVRGGAVHQVQEFLAINAC